MGNVRIWVQWEERHQVFGHVEVDEQFVDNRAAILEAIQEAKDGGYTFDTDPSTSPGMIDLSWYEAEGDDAE